MDIIGVDIITRRYANQNDRHTAKFENSGTKDDIADGILSGSYGEGKSPEIAIREYVQKIRGKLLVVNAASPNNRKEFFVPSSLS